MTLLIVNDDNQRVHMELVMRVDRISETVRENRMFEVRETCENFSPRNKAHGPDV